MRNHVLVIEDESLVRDSICELLTLEGYDVSGSKDGEDGLRKLKEEDFDIALVDLRLPTRSGIEVLKEAKEYRPNLDVVMMTGFATAETAVQAMKMGALDYLTKPLNDEELKILVRRVFENRKLREENQFLKQKVLERSDGFHNLIGKDPKMNKIYALIHAISDTDTTVLIKGDSGTGKGMIAQAVHYSDPSRREGPYVEVSCGAIPRELLESELFGHVKGAFTSAIRDRVGRFELANGGTIFLDEIDALPPYLQVKLLRVLQHKTFERVGDTKTIRIDMRIVAATNRDLEEEIKSGAFREDLYYRLNVITIDVPPLRERKEDIPALVLHFLKMFNDKARRKVTGITKEAMNCLLNYDWPGNVRELENSLERAVVLSQGEFLDVDLFPDSFARKQLPTSMDSLGQGTALKEVLQEPEKKIIVQALDHTGGNRKKAATLLKINRTTLYNKMKRYNLL